MPDDFTFSYALCARDECESELEARAERLLALVREHARKHDFAQRIHVDDARVAIKTVEREPRLILLLPFHKEHFPELAALNRYIISQAQQVGLVVAGMVLPDGSEIPFKT